jgi:hypothetical protein
LTGALNSCNRTVAYDQSMSRSFAYLMKVKSKV